MLFGDFAESQSKNFTDPIHEEESTEDYGYLSDSDLEDNEDEKVSPFNNTGESKGDKLCPPAVPASDGNFFEVQEERTEEGKVVKIPDMAFVT